MSNTIDLQERTYLARNERLGLTGATPNLASVDSGCQWSRRGAESDVVLAVAIHSYTSS